MQTKVMLVNDEFNHCMVWIVPKRDACYWFMIKRYTSFSAWKIKAIRRFCRTFYVLFRHCHAYKYTHTCHVGAVIRMHDVHLTLLQFNWLLNSFYAVMNFGRCMKWPFFCSHSICHQNKNNIDQVARMCICVHMHYALI